MDHFRPLYKLHRRGPATAFDCLRDDSWEGYTAECQTLEGRSLVWDTEFRVSYTEVRIPQIPGLRIYSGMLPQSVQADLVTEATGLYLEDSRHKTNFDAHMDLPRPIRLLEEPALHKKLRWVTLGGQYNWTTKVYPSFEVGTPECPEFPPRLGRFINRTFDVHADAAIVNYYSQGDILSPHQDVAELTASDLVSISLGCECIFYIGLQRHDCKPLPVLLRSGDILVMGGESRHAFHGVGRVFDGTNPIELDGALGEYMRGKRININVRQMFART